MEKSKNPKKDEQSWLENESRREYAAAAAASLFSSNPEFEKIGKEAAASLFTSSPKLKELIERINANPNADGWWRLNEILTEAKSDKRVLSSAGASSFLGLMKVLAEDAHIASNAEEAIQPLVKIIRSSISSESAIRRFSREREAKKWAIQEWLMHGVGYRSKSDFARIQVNMIRERFGIPSLTDRTIREKWLKGL
jgi:hypothetical protein